MLSTFYFITDDEDVCYTAVSGFVFLRFFAPAILNPKLFQMRNEHPVRNERAFLRNIFIEFVLVASVSWFLIVFAIEMNL